MKNPNYIYFTTISVIALLVQNFIFFQELSLNPTWIEEFFQSDALYIPLLHKDLVNDFSSLNSWRHPPAPSLFPDLFLYSFSSALFSNPIQKVLFYSFFQQAYFIISFYLWAKIKNISYPTSFSLITVSIFIYLSYSPFQFFYFLTHISSHHIGAFLNSILLFSIYSYIKEQRYRFLILLFIIISGASDKIFLISGVLPVLFSVTASYLKNRNRENLKQISMMLISSFLAYKLGKSLTPYNIEKLVLETINLSKIFSLFFNDLHFIFMNHIILIILFFLFIISIPFAIKFFSSKETVYLPLLSILFVCLFFLITGGYGNLFTFRRYFIPLLYFPIFFLIAIIHNHSIKITTGIALLFILIGFSTTKQNIFSRNYANLVSYYPPEIKCLDDLESQLPSLNGISDYWQAKRISFLSRKVNLNQATPNLFVHYWINNRKWYQEKRYGFVIENGLDRPSIEKVVGIQIGKAHV